MGPPTQKSLNDRARPCLKGNFFRYSRVNFYSKHNNRNNLRRGTVGRLSVLQENSGLFGSAQML